ncbi:hypothetical protein C8Q74DRAFT_1217675 [Fomes fomentarius]|nr:hypothetical protein C8Q74DRAFT_1217675 [Fomes fomentarius]
MHSYRAPLDEEGFQPFHLPPLHSDPRAHEVVYGYEVPLRPREPLHLWQRVKLWALSRTTYHTPNAVSPRYDVYDPHVVGTIIEVHSVGTHIVEFVLRNRCSRSPVRWVYLATRFVPGKSVILSARELREAWKDDARQVAMEEEEDVLVSSERRVMCSVEACAGEIDDQEPNGPMNDKDDSLRRPIEAKRRLPLTTGPEIGRGRVPLIRIILRKGRILVKRGAAKTLKRGRTACGLKAEAWLSPPHEHLAIFVTQHDLS